MIRVALHAVLGAMHFAWGSGVSVNSAPSNGHLSLLQRGFAKRTRSARTTGVYIDAQRSCSLLLFVPIGDVDRGAALWKDNLNWLRESLKAPCTAEVFFNHYDNGEDMWRQRGEQWAMGWYDDHVNYSANKVGRKFKVMQELLWDVDTNKYDWIWAVDEDLDITHTDVLRFLDLADSSRSLITLPAFTQAGNTPEEQQLQYPMQAPISECTYRYAPIVEMIFPMFKPAALNQILWHCDECIGQRATWGLDRMWCSFTAHRLGHDNKTACAIIDETPVTHQNFKTLAGKYDMQVKDHRLRRVRYDDDFHREASEWMLHVQEVHREDFVAGYGFELNSNQCVKDI